MLSQCSKDNRSVCGTDIVYLDSIPYAPQPYTVVLPMGFPPLVVPADNPLTLEGVRLGRHLFYETMLSGDGSMSCASCHQQAKGFADDGAFSLGIDGQPGVRNAMHLGNIGFASDVNAQGHNFMWDGRFTTLEDQVTAPIEDPLEFHTTWPEVLCRLRGSALYPRLFREAFGISNSEEITRELVSKAIAQFERTLVSANSRYDRFLLGTDTLSASEARGRLIFYGDALNGNGLPDAHCGHCHNGSQLSNLLYANNGLTDTPDLNGFPDKGLGQTTGLAVDNGRFKTPSLRNVALTAPYMHDGRFNTLEEVVEHYATGGFYSPNRNVELALLQQQAPLSAQDKADIVAFLRTFTDDEFIQNPIFGSPF